MKKILIVITDMMMCLSLCAQKVEIDLEKQHENIDKILMEVEYNYKHNEAPQYDTELRNDRLFLEIGETMAHSFTERERNIGTSIEKDWQLEKIHTHRSFDSCIGEVYNNYPTGKMTVITGLDLAGPFRHVEDVPDFKWKISDEHKQVMDYNCIKATCSFRGRDYEAWFTADIPISYGPWKFCGLPGLILEINDTKGEYFFVCKAIQKTDDKHITFWNREYKDCTRKEMRKYQNMLHRKPSEFTALYGRTIYTNKGPIKNEDWGYERNVIEKE